VPGDVAANLDQHVRLARLAIAGGAEVVVFPELSLTGYELEQADALAFQRIDARLEPLLSLARRAGALIIAGAPVRLGGALHIGAAVIDADGGLEWYTKRRVPSGGGG
jgi:predicted amidohydrolase